MIQTEIAVLRFGLGARPGDLAAAAGDPRGWLTEQIKGAAPLAGNTPLAASDQIFTELLSARDKFQEMKREAAAQSSADPHSSTDPKAAAAPAFNPVRDAYLPHYRAQVLAGAQSAALTTRPFAERLVHRGALAQRPAGLDKALRALKDQLGSLWQQTAVLVVTEFGHTAG